MNSVKVLNAIAASPWPHLQPAEVTEAWNGNGRTLEVLCWVPRLVTEPQPPAPSCQELREYLVKRLAIPEDVGVIVELHWPAPRYYPGDEGR